MEKLLIIGLGGFLGANFRYLVGMYVAERFGSAFPYGTFLINITGSFAIGLFLALASERFVHLEGLRPLLVVGFLGAYTTFSTFSMESFALIEAKAYASAAVNMLGSATLGIAAAALGVYVGRLV